MSIKKRIALAGCGALCALPLTSCDTSKLSDELANTVEGIVPNLYVVIAQILIFCAVCALVIFLAYKPLRRKIAERKQHIADSIAQAEQDKDQAKVELEKAAQVVASAQAEAGQIIQHAQAVAEENAAQAQRELSASIEQQRQQAHRDIEDERQKMLKEAHEQIVTTALDASRQILGREISVEDNRKLVDDFIDQIAGGREKQ